MLDLLGSAGNGPTLTQNAVRASNAFALKQPDTSPTVPPWIKAAVMRDTSLYFEPQPRTFKRHKLSELAYGSSVPGLQYST